MTPEERQLLERTLKLSEENNVLLRKMRNSARWATLWRIVTILIFFVIPLVVGYFYLEPYLGTFGNSLKQAQELLGSLK